MDLPVSGSSIKPPVLRRLHVPDVLGCSDFAIRDDPSNFSRVRIVTFPCFLAILANVEWNRRSQSQARWHGTLQAVQAQISRMEYLGANQILAVQICLVGPDVVVARPHSPTGVVGVREKDD